MSSNSTVKSKLSQPERSDRLNFFSMTRLKSRIRRKSTKPPNLIENEESTSVAETVVVTNISTKDAVPPPKSELMFVKPEPQFHALSWNYTPNRRTRKQKVKYFVRKMKSKLAATKISVKKRWVIIYDQNRSTDSIEPDYAIISPYSQYDHFPIFNKQSDYSPITAPNGSKRTYRSRDHLNPKGLPYNQLPAVAYYESMRRPDMRIGCSKDLEKPRSHINPDYYLPARSKSQYGLASPNRRSKSRKSKAKNNQLKID